MHRLRLIHWMIAIAAPATAALGIQAPGRAETPCPPGPVDAARVVKDVPIPCLPGLVVVDHGVGATVPPRGMGVVVTAETERGPQTLQLESDRKGALRVGSVGAEGTLGSPAGTVAIGDANPCPTCPRACEDRATNPYSFHLPPGETFEWRFHRDSTPKRLTPDQAETAAIRAVARVVTSRNQCGMADRVEINAAYLGDTSATADVSPDLVCAPFGRSDGLSVLDFGPLKAPAVNCSWYVLTDGLGHLVEADVRVRETDPWTVEPNRAGCKNEWDLEGILVHERGHSFGLAHVGSKHGNLTMSTWGLPPCSSAYRTFVRGDVRGLRILYSPAATT